MPDDTQKNQTIIGFGGAFTDAAGINIAKLSSGAQQNLISAYFGPEGDLIYKKSITITLKCFRNWLYSWPCTYSKL